MICECARRAHLFAIPSHYVQPPKAQARIPKNGPYLVWGALLARGWCFDTLSCVLFYGYVGHRQEHQGGSTYDGIVL